MFAYVNHARIRSWNQPALSNEGKISSSRKQRDPSLGLKLTTDKHPPTTSQTLPTAPRSPVCCIWHLGQRYLVGQCSLTTKQISFKNDNMKLSLYGIILAENRIPSLYTWHCRKSVSCRKSYFLIYMKATLILSTSCVIGNEL